jgi:hypothetical protein
MFSARRVFSTHAVSGSRQARCSGWFLIRCMLFAVNGIPAHHSSPRA